MKVFINCAEQGLMSFNYTCGQNKTNKLPILTILSLTLKSFVGSRFGKVIVVQDLLNHMLVGNRDCLAADSDNRAIFLMKFNEVFVSMLYIFEVSFQLVTKR